MLFGKRSYFLRMAVPEFQKYKKNFQTELELRVRDSWIMNQFLDPANQEFVKLPFFKNRVFTKYEHCNIGCVDFVKVNIALTSYACEEI